MVIDFVDVSEHQGQIWWDQVPCPAVIKATEGKTFIDRMFRANRDGARLFGRCMGFYHFLASTSDGSDQARFFLDTVGPLEPGELLVLDWETDSIGVRPDEHTAAMFVDTIVAAGHKDRLRLYANNWGAAYAAEWGVPFWCAWYGDVEDRVRNLGAAAWQWSSSGQVAGITSRVDTNQILTPEWTGALMATAAEIAEAVWTRPISLAGQNYPAAEVLGFVHGELTRPDLLVRRIVDAVAELDTEIGLTDRELRALAGHVVRELAAAIAR